MTALPPKAISGMSRWLTPSQLANAAKMPSKSTALNSSPVNSAMAIVITRTMLKTLAKLTKG